MNPRSQTLALVEAFLDRLQDLEVRDLRLSLIDAAGQEHRWSLSLGGPDEPLAQRRGEFAHEVEMAAIRWGFQPDSLAWRDRESAAEGVEIFADFRRIEP